MDDKEFDSEYSLLVKIEPVMSAEDVNFNCLEMYMENLTGNDCALCKFNGTRSYAIINFKEPISDIDELQKKNKEKPLVDYKVTFETIPLVDKVIVTDLPSEQLSDITNLADSELVLYFENKKFCPDGGDVTELKMLSCNHGAVVQFQDHNVVKKLKTKHKLRESHFTVRLLSIFEFVEGPCCHVCQDDKVADNTVDDEEASWHSAHEDTGSRKYERGSGSQSNSDMDVDMEELKNWATEHTDNNGQKRNEHSSFTGEKSNLEILEHDKKKKDHTRKASEGASGFGEVELADYTKVADKLNCFYGRKWITELLDDLKIPASLKDDKSTLSLTAINLEAAEEAAKTVANSLLPARVKCDRNQLEKCLKVLHGKIVIQTEFNSGYFEFLGIPMDVLKAVGEIEQKLHRSYWPMR